MQITDLQSKSRPKSTLLLVVGAAGEMGAQSVSRPRLNLSMGNNGLAKCVQAKVNPIVGGRCSG